MYTMGAADQGLFPNQAPAMFVSALYHTCNA